MNVRAELKYTKSHEWARREADGSITVGITDHAQELLGDMVFVECPEAGRKLKQGEECAVVESVKAASDVYAPVSGEVIDSNALLQTEPEKINEDPYGAWMFKLRPSNPAEYDALLDAAAYQTLAEE